MKKQLLSTLVLSGFILFFTVKSQAQVSAIPFTASLDTFAAITGTTLDAPNVDDVVYQNIPIGFNFNLGGTWHSVMSVNTNGYVELDSTGTASFVNILNSARNNIVAPFAADLMHQDTNASLQYATIGTSPNRVCIVQWLHYSYFGGSAGDINFQLRLYETSNCIQFVYGSNYFLTSWLQTQIGIRGTTNLDYLVLGDTTCNWANAYPFPGITTPFPVNLSCSMPAGFAFNFGGCNPGNSINFSYLTGKVFDDKNGNGVADFGEPGLKNHILNIQPGNYYVSSDANGDYAFFFFDSTLTYSISASPILYWNQTNNPAVISCNPQTQSSSGLDFGFQQIPNVHEVEIHCPNWGAKPLQPEPMPIWFTNNGTSTESDTITFVMDSLYSFISATPAPSSVNGQTITWAYANLAPGQNGYINLQLLPSGNAVLGNFLNSTLTIGPKFDTIPGNNVLHLNQLITNSWDPNEKLAEPSGMIDAGTTINYTIHFQNTGNAAADNVTVRDTLDSNLDLLSFNLIGASHPVNFAMDGNGFATFTFYNIQLPDSGSNLAGSNGYVCYSVKTKNALAPLTVINNKARIYFDYNPAIITNTTADTIKILLGMDSHNSSNLLLNAQPNPVKDKLVLIFETDQTEAANLEITTLEGQLIIIQQNFKSGDAINTGTLPSGLYLCTVKTKSSTQTIKFVKE